MKMSRAIFFLFFALLGFVGADNFASQPQILISSVKRTADLTSQLVKYTNVITFENPSSTSVSFLYIALDQVSHQHLSYISAKEQSSKKVLKVVPVQLTNVPAAKNEVPCDFYKIRLYSQLEPKKTMVLVLKEVYFDLQKPLPGVISQNEPQFMLYHYNSHYLSPYSVKQQTLVLTLASDKVLDYTKADGVSLSARKLTVLSSSAQPPMSYRLNFVHFQNNEPFLSVESLHRTIEVSHWGMIHVRDDVWIKHRGAKFDGVFSRIDYMRTGNGQNLPSFEKFIVKIPASASNIYYRDEIGNISTSDIRHDPKNLLLDIKTRFPLFGGWETNFYVSYQLPVHLFLSAQGSAYSLQLDFLLRVSQDTPYRKVDVTVILPETSSNIDLQIPFDVKRLNDSLTFTYLDTVGRPTVHFQKENVCDEFIVPFQLNYEFSSWMLLREPFMLVVAFLCLFFCVIVYVRLDFSINKNSRKSSLGLINSKVGVLVEKVLKIQNDRANVYALFDSSCENFVKSQNLPKFQSEKALHDSTLEKLTASFKEILSKLVAESSQSALVVEYLNRVQQIEADKVSSYSQLYSLYLRLVSKDVKLPAFRELEKSLRQQISKLDDDVEKIFVSNLGY
eukprot:Sdes_comp19272_c0_seq1m10273